MANEPGFTPVGSQATPGFTPVSGASGAQPAMYQSQTTDETMPLDVAKRHAKSRIGAPRPDERGAGEKALDWARGTFGGRVAGAAGGEAIDIGEGIGEVAKAGMPTTADEAISTALSPMTPALKMFQKAFIDPAIDKGASAKQAFQSGDYTKGTLGALGTINPMSPDLAQLYDTASKDPAEAIGKGGMDIFALATTDAKLREHLTGIRRIAEQAPAMKQGYIGLNKSVQNAAHIAENNLTGPTGAIGRHAQAVIEQSAQDAKMKSLPGEVSTADAQAAGQKQAMAVRRPDMLASHPPYYTMAEAKDTISRIGKTAIKFENAGKAPEASVLWSEYDKLREATQQRADALGGTYGKSWKYYISEFHNYMQVRKGLLGDVLDAQTSDDHIAAMKKMTGGEGPGIKPEMSAKHPDVPRMKEWLKQYGADPKLVDAAVEQGQQLNKLTQQSKNFFISKIRGIANHPVIAGSAGVAAYGAASLSGIPMAHFIVPLLVIGRISGLLDAADAVKLVRDISKRVGPEAMHGIPAPQGEPPMPSAGAATGTTGSYTADVPSTTPSVGLSHRDILNQRRQAPGESPTGAERRGGAERRAGEARYAEATHLDKLYDDLAKETDPEDKARVQRNIDDIEEQKANPQAAQAEQVKKARSVYKGRRGGTK